MIVEGKIRTYYFFGSIDLGREEGFRAQLSLKQTW
jgi:hypothetical protein